jgi:hypothetical protein
VRCARLTWRDGQDKKWDRSAPLPSAGVQGRRGAQCGHQEPQPRLPIIQPLPNPAAPPASGRSGRRPASQPFWTASDRASIRPRASLAALRPRAGAQVAQLVEHVTENHGVGGSIPPLGTTISLGKIIRLEHLAAAGFFELGARRGHTIASIDSRSPLGYREHIKNIVHIGAASGRNGLYRGN